MGTLRKIGQGIKSFFKRKQVKSNFIPEPVTNIDLIPQKLLKRPRKRNLVAKKLKRRKWKFTKCKRRMVNVSKNINRKAA